VIVDGNDVDTAPRQLHRAAVRWDAAARLALEAEWLVVGEYWLDAANAHRYPGHELLNLRGRWQAAPQWSVTLRLNNALDRDYADRADFAFGNYRYFPGARPRAVRGSRLGEALSDLRPRGAAPPSDAGARQTSAAARRAPPPRPPPASPGTRCPLASRGRRVRRACRA
jgi:hypothetical protein